MNMPAPIDYTGRKYGHLTFKRFDPKESAGTGKRYWQLSCKCGGTTTVPAGRVITGNTTSCGCQKGKQGRKNAFTKAATRQAHKEKEVVEHDGMRYLTPRKAMAFLGVSRPTLEKWADIKGTGCPWLNGEVLDSCELPNALNRQFRHFPEPELIRVREAMRKQAKVPEYPGFTYVETARKELGISLRTLRRMAAAQIPPTRIEKKTAKSADGRARTKAYISTEFVEAMKAKRKEVPVPAERLTVAEAAVELKIDNAAVHRLLKVGKLSGIIGKKLVDAAPRGDGKRLHYARKATLVSRASVERLKRELRGEPEPVTAVPPEQTAAPSNAPKRKGKRGRPKGSIDPEVQERNRKIRADKAAGTYPSDAELARAYGVQPPNLHAILNASKIGREKRYI